MNATLFFLSLYLFILRFTASVISNLFPVFLFFFADFSAFVLFEVSWIWSVASIYKKSRFGKLR